jgi:hypothetical protein
MDLGSLSPEKSRPKLGPSSSSESRHLDGKGRPTYNPVTVLVSKLGRKGMELNTEGSPPALEMSCQGVTSSSRPASGRPSVAGTSCLTVWGVGTSHPGGGGTKRVDVESVGPGVILTLARPLERESASLISLGVSLGHGVPWVARSRLFRLYLLQQEGQ